MPPAPGSRPLCVLMVASEAVPVCKTGGLADVVTALASALRRDARAEHETDARILLPAYRGVTAPATGPTIPLGDPLGLGETWLEPVRIDDVPAWLLHNPALYDRPGGPYLDAEGRDHPDNAQRFAALGHAAASFSLLGPAIGFRPDVVHAHDWQAGLTCAYLAHLGGRRPATMFTVHNLEFWGPFAAAELPAMALPTSMYAMEGIEAYGRASALKAGLYYADHVTTVSITYAAELRVPGGAYGLDGLLRTRGSEFTGIVNGIDATAWNPADDPALPRHYDAADPSGKALVRTSLLRELELDPDPGGPVFGIVSRLTAQKGIDLVLEAIEGVVAGDGRLAVLGSGLPELELALAEAAAARPGRVAFVRGYDDRLARRIMAGSDVLLVPSRFEPCGLTQMYAIRYGTLPLVRRTGGLADTVVDVDADPERGTGFCFQAPLPEALLQAVARAHAAFRDGPRWSAMVRQAMLSADRFDWQHPAAQYREIYAKIALRRAHGPVTPPT